MLEAEMLEQGAEKVSDSLLLGSFKDNTTVHAGHTTSLSLSSLRIYYWGWGTCHNGLGHNVMWHNGIRHNLKNGNWA